MIQKNLQKYNAWRSRRIFKTWPLLEEQFPQELNWVKEEIHSRRRSVLERSEFIDRMYCSVRFPNRIVRSALQLACFGTTEITLNNAQQQDEPINWLIMIGTMDLVAEQLWT